MRCARLQRRFGQACFARDVSTSDRNVELRREERLQVQPDRCPLVPVPIDDSDIVDPRHRGEVADQVRAAAYGEVVALEGAIVVKRLAAVVDLVLVDVEAVRACLMNVVRPVRERNPGRELSLTGGDKAATVRGPAFRVLHPVEPEPRGGLLEALFDELCIGPIAFLPDLPFRPVVNGVGDICFSAAFPIVLPRLGQIQVAVQQRLEAVGQSRLGLYQELGLQ